MKRLLPLLLVVALFGCAQPSGTAAPQQRALVAVESTYTPLANDAAASSSTKVCSTAIAADIKSIDADVGPAILKFRAAVESGSTLGAAVLVPVGPALSRTAADLSKANGLIAPVSRDVKTGLSPAASTALQGGLVLLNAYVATLS